MYQDVFANCPKFNGISITEMHYCLCDIITSKYLEDKQYAIYIYRNTFRNKKNIDNDIHVSS